jgi:hypothetical protein
MKALSNGEGNLLNADDYILANVRANTTVPASTHATK